MKEKFKEAQDELKLQEKQANIEHKKIIGLEEKCRKLSQLLREHNRGEPVVLGNTPDINENVLDDLESELKRLTKLKITEQNRYIKTDK